MKFYQESEQAIRPGLQTGRLRVFSLRKEPAFSVHSTAVLVGRAKQVKVGGGSETARVFIFLAASPLVRALLRVRRSVVHPTKPPCYAGYRHFATSQTVSPRHR